MSVVVEQGVRKAVIDTIRGGYQVIFSNNKQKVGARDFDADGTKGGDIEAQQQAQDAADTWVQLGKLPDHTSNA